MKHKKRYILTLLVTESIGKRPVPALIHFFIRISWNILTLFVMHEEDKLCCE